MFRYFFPLSLCTPKTLYTHFVHLYSRQPYCQRLTPTPKHFPRTDSASGTRLSRSAAVSATAHGSARRQNDAAAHVGDVVRQEQAAAGVLVQCAEEPHRRAVPFHQHMGAASVRRTGRGADCGARFWADSARYGVGEGHHYEGMRLRILFMWERESDCLRNGFIHMQDGRTNSEGEDITELTRESWEVSSEYAIQVRSYQSPSTDLSY